MLRFCLLSTAARSSLYFINGVAIPSQNFCSHLGSDYQQLSLFCTHINNVASEARKSITVPFRGFVTPYDFNIMRQASVNYTRHFLEYSSVVWNPRLIYSHRLAQLKTFSVTLPNRFCPCLRKDTYSDYIFGLILNLSELWRIKSDFINYFKVFNHLTPLDLKVAFLIYKHPLYHVALTHLTCNKLAKHPTNYKTPYFIQGVDA
jgi:hypothetical protein